jgi:replicative DNA helicase
MKADWQSHLRHVKELQILRELGQIAGIPTGLKHLDIHWGGLQKATSYLVLGRPGDAKSFFQAKLAVEGMLAGERIGLFSPEMTEHQHRCRINTLLSANSKIQEACGLSGAFRNRALKDGYGFNLKRYKRFLEYIEQEVPGEIHLFTQKYRREKMTPHYIESRVEDLGITCVIVDPIYKLKSPRHRKLRYEELSDITDSLQDMSQGFNIPIVMSNQATRSLVGQKGEPPTKDSSFGADAPVQEADCVIGLKHYSEERCMKLNCSKNRHGEPFKFTVSFHPNIGRMEDVTPISTDYFNGYDPEKAEELREAMKEVPSE